MDELEQLVTELQANDLSSRPVSTMSQAPPSTPPRANPTPAPPPVPRQNTTPAGEIPDLNRRKTTLIPKNKVSTSVVSSKVCFKCNKPIEGDITIALNNSWHTNCLSCSQCQTLLSGDFYEHDGHQVCKNCMASRIRCSKCGQAIVKDYFIGEGKIFHPSCVDVISCVKCHNVIEPTQHKLTALGKTFHQSCFVCTTCNTQLGLNFYQKDNQPYCENCSVKTNVPGGGTCAFCSNPLDQNTQFVRYESSVYHQRCFKCHKCRSDLDLSAFYNVGGKPTCQTCVVSLSKT